MAKNSKVPGLGLHALLRVAAALLGVVAFIMMFLDQVEVFLADNSLGKAGMDALFGNADSALLKNGSVISFIGYILVAAGAVCSVLSLFLFKGKKIDLLLLVIAGLAMIAGAVMIFVMPAVLKDSNKTLLNYEYKLVVAPILAGIFGAVGGDGPCLAVSFIAHTVDIHIFADGIFVHRAGTILRKNHIGLVVAHIVSMALYLNLDGRILL